MNPTVLPLRYTGARRGVFGLQSWAPLREPGQPSTSASVNFGIQSDRQSVNAPQFPVVHSKQPVLQQQRNEAQSAQQLYSTSAEHAANCSGDGSKINSDAVKPCELFIKRYRLNLKYMSIKQMSCCYCSTVIVMIQW